MPIDYPKAHFSPAKDQRIVLDFRREEVERGDVRRVYGIRSGLIDSKEAAEFGEGRLLFYFSGWDEDPREIGEIPDIRRWFVRLTEMFPYWLHFVEKTGSTLSHTLMLLCPGQMERSPETGTGGWRFTHLEDVRDRVWSLLSAQNVLHDRLGLSAEMNERISQEVAEFIRCSFA
jgi:hypothetical protein